MKLKNIADMKLGWFVGDFDPTILKTDNFEVAYKVYKAGDKEVKHLHKIATEVTLIASGLVKMNGIEYSSGQIILLEPGEATDFEAIEDTTTVVVKTPSVMNDKYNA